MMAAPGGAPVAGMGTTGHGGPGGGSGGGGFNPGPGSGSGSIAATASATVTANSSQLTAEQKRKLLWGAKKVETVVNQGAESLFGANRWDRAAEVRCGRGAGPDWKRHRPSSIVLALGCD
ncbi:hypothetical protein Vafri_3585 [Volvox africanus]|uniref:Uncharacterized protein n=1 Tax=Volvox africanus TaxID=51714 RepID=A0A8J4AS72_9CHLO|nr:hypothetical protein Vafri_3585 [Volvox africanus]